MKWLRERLADGFDVHHLDGDHDNDHPSNLILLETVDHTRTIHQLAFTRLKAVAAARERSKRITAAFEAAGMKRGSYVRKVVKGKRYWYFQDMDRKQHYIGPEFPYLLTVIAGYKQEKRELLKAID